MHSNLQVVNFDSMVFIKYLSNHIKLIMLLTVIKVLDTLVDIVLSFQ